jgi:hypothetical protein
LNIFGCWKDKKTSIEIKIHDSCWMSIFICAKVAWRPFHSFPNGVKKNLGATNSLRRTFIIHLNVNKVLICLQVECQKFNMCQKITMNHHFLVLCYLNKPKGKQFCTNANKQTPYKSSLYELKIYHFIEIILLVLRGNYYSSSPVVFVWIFLPFFEPKILGNF